MVLRGERFLRVHAFSRFHHRSNITGASTPHCGSVAGRQPVMLVAASRTMPFWWLRTCRRCRLHGRLGGHGHTRVYGMIVWRAFSRLHIFANMRREWVSAQNLTPLLPTQAGVFQPGFRGIEAVRTARRNETETKHSFKTILKMGPDFRKKSYDEFMITNNFRLYDCFSKT